MTQERHQHPRATTRHRATLCMTLPPRAKYTALTATHKHGPAPYRAMPGRDPAAPDRPLTRPTANAKAPPSQAAPPPGNDARIASGAPQRARPTYQTEIRKRTPDSAGPCPAKAPATPCTRLGEQPSASRPAKQSHTPRQRPTPSCEHSDSHHQITRNHSPHGTTQNLQTQKSPDKGAFFKLAE